ncbi:MAG: DUF2243 domain-containing protein [Opitutaceae bacterium]|nr:DUF2243 domain-containing protein [Opitutaceae bacterium]
MNSPPHSRSLRIAGVVLGLGLGGFFDGIVFHQILGWHHMVCTTFTCQPDSIAALRVQIVQDGWFHLVVWLLTITGVVLLFRSARQHALTGLGRALLGAVLAGWGVFNLVEGLIDHHLLNLHHVRPGHPHELLFDLLFLAFGLLLIGLGRAFSSSVSPSVRKKARL